MALQKIPRATLHRSSLANIARIIKENMNFAVAKSGDAMPVMLPYRKSIARFFKEVNTAHGGIDNSLISVAFDRRAINAAIKLVAIEQATTPKGGVATVTIASPEVEVTTTPKVAKKTRKKKVTKK